MLFQTFLCLDVSFTGFSQDIHAEKSDNFHEERDGISQSSKLFLSCISSRIAFLWSFSIDQRNLSCQSQHFRRNLLQSKWRICSVLVVYTAVFSHWISIDIIDSSQSLENVLFKTDHKLGRNFRASFIRHILKVSFFVVYFNSFSIQGLSWIHSSNINVHGSLFLSNCVVDSYWVVKLTDFGLRSLINSKAFLKQKIKRRLLTQFQIKSKEIFCFPMFNFEDLPHSKKWMHDQN